MRKTEINTDSTKINSKNEALLNKIIEGLNMIQKICLENEEVKFILGIVVRGSVVLILAFLAVIALLIAIRIVQEVHEFLF